MKVHIKSHTSGISLACRQSLNSRNVVYNLSNAGVHIYSYQSLCLALCYTVDITDTCLKYH